MYQQLYKQIIDQAKHQNRQKGQGVYYEWHHIVPEFMFKDRKRKGPVGHLSGDPNHPDNLVLLTFQEHLMCHYYLYEMHKDSKYGYQAGSALQFFFTKAGNGHKRQINLSEVDQEFLNSMAHLRELGISSISKARKGKMPVVDVVTKKSMGSVPVDHPKVLSGEWVHHSKGKPGHNKRKRQDGSHNNNFKAMTPERRARVLDCVGRSLVDGYYFSVARFEDNLKLEFKEFKKVSQRWIINNFRSMHQLVDEYNMVRGSTVVHDPNYKSKETKNKISNQLAGRSWVTNGVRDTLVAKKDLDQYLLLNPDYSKGRTHA
jgi:hypothetical protein